MQIVNGLHLLNPVFLNGVGDLEKSSIAFIFIGETAAKLDYRVKANV